MRAPRSSVPTNALSRLRDDVHQYHIEVTEALATINANCGHCHQKVSEIDLQVNGSKPENKDAPGLKADVDSLKQSRDSQRRGLKYAWTVLAGIGSLLVGVWKYR